MKLNKEQYFEWRCIISELHLSEEKLKSGTFQVESMSKDLEIGRLKTLLAKQSLTTLKEVVDLRKKEYQEIKERLEKELNISLNNKVISDITYEISELE